MHKAIKATSNHGHILAKLVVTTTLFTLCGCTPDLEFEKKFSTDHFDYYMETRLEHLPCDDAQQWLERYYEGISKFLGVTLPAGQKIQYHVIGDAWDPRTECTRAIPCALGTTIYSGDYVGRHEIVRATASLLGDPPLYFQQGLAEVLGCGNAWDAKGPIDKMWFEDMVESSFYERHGAAGNEDIRPTTGSFVRHLMDTYGTAKFLSFYAHAPRDGTRAQIDAVFEQEFGGTLHDEFLKWIKLPALVPGDICMRVMECDSSMPELTNGDVQLGCGPDGYNWASKEGLFRFHIENDHPKQIITEPMITDPQEISFIDLLGCSGGAAMPAFSFTADLDIGGNSVTATFDPLRNTRRFVFDAPAGDYFARFRAKGEAVIHAQMVDAPSPMRDACTPAAEPLLIADNETVVLASRWMERTCNGFWCPGNSWDVKIGPNGGAIEAYPWTTEGRVLFSPTKIYLCSDPCPTSSEQCETLDFDPEVSPKLVQSKQVFAPGTVVHVGAPLAPFYEHFSVHMRVVQP